MKGLILCIAIFTCKLNFAQYKSYIIGIKKDTLNIVDKNGKKQGRWVIKVEELRGEPGYEEEGVFKNDKKEGIWRKYSLQGDLIAIENYRLGCLHGQSRYFNEMGDLLREESWRGYDPEHPFDTIPIYNERGDITNFKIVPAKPYSLKHGEWKYFDPQTGKIVKVEEYELNAIKGSDGIFRTEEQIKKIAQYPKKPVYAPADKSKIAKPKEALDFDKKNNKKKKYKVIDGRTGI